VGRFKKKKKGYNLHQIITKKEKGKMCIFISGSVVEITAT